MERSSGILLPISSLPSKYGIGTFGKAAYEYADFLKAAGQKYWQLLPLGPTGYADSPYASFSTFAGNPYFIDLEMLIADGLLKKAEVEAENWGTNPRYVDYGQVYDSRFKILAKAKARGWDRDKDSVMRFKAEHQWVDNYALFMALKHEFDQVCWLEWPDEDIRMHKAEAVAKYTAKLKDEIELYTYIQYLFYKQWKALKTYINDSGIDIIGDIPIYVAMDSCEVWAETRFFMLDEENYPVEVSGVPPDYFSEDGQLWGNPIYNWKAMKADGYKWWINRIAGATEMYDVIRIDHFRGFDEYWSIKYGEKTAKNGKWKPGPGMDLVGLLIKEFPDTEFIAEDLGQPSPTVVKLLKDSNWPGMKVLGFAFDSQEPNNYQPHTYGPNCVCYTGTHDNATILEWAEEADAEDVEYAKTYLGIGKEEPFNWGMIRGGMASVANLFVAQMQDYLDLGRYNRINVPSTTGSNWQWRMLPTELSDELAQKICKMSVMYGRAILPEEEEEEAEPEKTVAK